MQLIRHLVNSPVGTTGTNTVNIANTIRLVLHFKFANQEYCVIVERSKSTVLVKERYVISGCSISNEANFRSDRYPYFVNSEIGIHVSSYEDIFISDLFSSVNLDIESEIIKHADICGHYLMDRHHYLKN